MNRARREYVVTSGRKAIRNFTKTFYNRDVHKNLLCSVASRETISVGVMAIA